MCGEWKYVHRNLNQISVECYICPCWLMWNTSRVKQPLIYSCRYFRVSVVERLSHDHGRLSRSIAFLAFAHGIVCCNECYCECYMIFLCIQYSVATVYGMQFFCCIFRLLYFSFLHDFFNTFEPSLYPTRRWLVQPQTVNRSPMAMTNHPIWVWLIELGYSTRRSKTIQQQVLYRNSHPQPEDGRPRRHASRRTLSLRKK